jgi:hypothetical protein
VDLRVRDGKCCGVDVAELGFGVMRHAITFGDYKDKFCCASCSVKGRR